MATWTLTSASGVGCAGSAGAAGSAGLAPFSEPAVSSVSRTVPSETLSPTLTTRSVTLPAAGEGTSIVALSDSRTTSGSSTPTSSPGPTRTSMIGTASKSPISGTFTSISGSPRARAGPLEQHPSQIGQLLHQVRDEAGGERTVDHAVVVGQRERHHQPGHELAAVPDGLHGAAGDAEDRDLGRVDDRREARAADAAERRDRERRALHVGAAELARARLARQLAQILGDLQDALGVGVLDDRDHEPVRRVGGEADVVVALEDQV